VFSFLKARNREEKPRILLATGNLGTEIVEVPEIPAFREICETSQSGTPMRRKRTVVACKTRLLVIGLGT
jgi:hypothetical protein